MKNATIFGCKLGYVCDHGKHAQCEKTSCAFNPDSGLTTNNGCYSTDNIAFAKLDEKGEPIIASITYKDAVFVRFGDAHIRGAEVSAK